MQVDVWHTTSVPNVHVEVGEWQITYGVKAGRRRGGTMKGREGGCEQECSQRTRARARVWSQDRLHSHAKRPLDRTYY